MTDSTKKSLCCCTIMAIAAILFIGGILIYIYSRPIVIKGDDNFTDEHKSLIEQMSLLSLSNNSGSGFSWSWAGAVLVLAIIGGLAYAYYRKIKLPRHRANREASQQQATQQQRQQEFLLELMNRPAPH